MSEQEIRNLIYALDFIARDYSHVQYGLPISDDRTMKEMINAVQSALVIAAQREAQPAPASSEVNV